MDRLFQKARSELRAIAEEHLPSSTELRSAITTSFKEMAKLTIDAAEDLPERLLEVQTVTSDTYRRVVHPMAKALASRITVRGRYKLQLLLGVTLIVQSVMLALGNGMALNYSAPVNMPGLPPILPDLAMLSAPLYVLKYGFLRVNNGLLQGYGAGGRNMYGIVRFLDDLFFPPLYTALFVSFNALAPKNARRLPHDVPLTIAAMDYIENAILTVLFFIFEEGNLNGGVLARLLASVVPLVQTIKFAAMFITLYALAAQFILSRWRRWP